MRIPALLLFVVGCASASTQDKTPYAIKGLEFEGCECESVCPCVFQNDASFNDCRALIAWRVDEGSYGKTDLKGVVFAAALTKSGKNIEKVMGKWEGVVYLSEQNTEDQRKAAAAILKAELGGAFAKLEVKTVPITAKSEGEKHSLEIGKVGTLKISGIKGRDGRVPVIENAPSPVAQPRMHCAKADVHKYDDGTSKWDFAGRNGFYGAFEMKSK